MELQLEDPSPSEVSTLEEAHAVIDELIQQLKVRDCSTEPVAQLKL